MTDHKGSEKTSVRKSWAGCWKKALTRWKGGGAYGVVAPTIVVELLMGGVEEEKNFVLCY
jgi:hypothetical protein